MAVPTKDHKEFFDLAAQAAHHKHEMHLWPFLWKGYNVRQTLRWQDVRFGKHSRNKVPSRPGVYAFIVRPSIANLHIGYLMYIGRARKSLRTRFGEYLTSERNPYKGRPRMATLLHQYEGYLQFRYATLVSPATVTRIERKLIRAFLPPVNEQVEAEIRAVIAAF